jgi:hypothetical protein
VAGEQPDAAVAETLGGAGARALRRAAEGFDTLSGAPTPAKESR